MPRVVNVIKELRVKVELNRIESLKLKLVHPLTFEKHLFPSLQEELSLMPCLPSFTSLYCQRTKTIYKFEL